MSNKIETCEVCSVRIDTKATEGKNVLFSFGEPGSYSKLCARVCQYVKPDKAELCWHRKRFNELKEWDVLDEYLKPGDNVFRESKNL